jgi:hypothetical protein
MKATPEMRAAFKAAYAQGSIWTDRLDCAIDAMLKVAPTQGADARPVNQCDGCRAGHIIGQSGLHEYEGHGYMTCQAKRYVSADARPVAIDAHPFALMCDALPADFSWGDPLTPGVFRHIESALAARDAAPSDANDMSREQLLEALQQYENIIQGYQQNSDAQRYQWLKAQKDEFDKMAGASCYATQLSNILWLKADWDAEIDAAIAASAPREKT